MEDAIKLAAVKVARKYFPSITELSPQQFRILTSVIAESKDTLAILPTGHGKSLPYQLAPYISKELELSAIMEIQVNQLKKAGISACFLHVDTTDKQELMQGNFSIVFGTPEAWLESKEWQEMLRSKVYQERLLLLVADEAHCVPNW
eukprot:gene17127-18848_t